MDLKLKPKFRRIASWVRRRLNKSGFTPRLEGLLGDCLIPAAQIGVAVAAPVEHPFREVTRKKALLVGISAIHEKCKHVIDAKKAESEGLKEAPDVEEAPGDDGPVQDCGLGALNGPWNDVAETKALLIEVYKYRPQDIITLVDTEDQAPELLPTLENLEKHMKELVADSGPGDRFYFHFSGHAGQEETTDPDEEDKMNEYICTLENKIILDDQLHEWLISSCFTFKVKSSLMTNSMSGLSSLFTQKVL